jgi:hypothetical protein
MCALPSCSSPNDKRVEKPKDKEVNAVVAPTEYTTSSSDSILTEQDFNVENDVVTNSVAIAPPPNPSKVSVVIHGEMQDYGGNEEFGREAAKILERVINSDEFHRLVATNTYLNDKGLTSEQIYALIQKAHEADGPGGSDGVLDLRLRTITLAKDGPDWIAACFKTTVGKDGGDTGIAATCSNWIDARKREGNYSYLAGHYLHEYMHILGFDHFKLSEADKYKSVPYKIGYFVRDLGTNYEKPLKGLVKPDQTFATMIDGTPQVLSVYKSSMHVEKQELLDLSKYIGKMIRIKFENYSSSDGYGAKVIK